MEGHREVLDRQNLLNEANNEFNSHHWKRAEDLYTEFIDICMASGERDSNDLAIAFNNRGQVKYFRVDFYEAVDDYSAAIKANRQFEVAYYNRGLIRYRLDTWPCGEFMYHAGIEDLASFANSFQGKVDE